MPDFIPVDHQPEFDAEQFVPPIVADWAKQAAGKDVNTLRGVGEGLKALTTLPERALGAAANLQTTGDYNPAPIVETALTMMGGGVGGVEGGGATLAAGARRGLPGSSATEAYRASVSAKPISEMTDQELAAWRAQNAAEDAERARTFTARHSAADTPAAKRERALQDQQNAADDAQLHLQDASEDKNTTLGSGATDKKTAAMIQAIRAYHGSPAGAMQPKPSPADMVNAIRQQGG